MTVTAGGAAGRRRLEVCCVGVKSGRRGETTRTKRRRSAPSGCGFGGSILVFLRERWRSGDVVRGMSVVVRGPVVRGPCRP
ncbi:MAG TPA: hypothetical protein ENF26_03150 [Methanomicrobia archaeon]|nr:hypothetical protein [Methanomicrobia archaeon]HEX59130.1 hypothetical protein [Methanomicrobia archaeon]